jgi:hypothetical protein
MAFNPQNAASSKWAVFESKPDGESKPQLALLYL